MCVARIVSKAAYLQVKGRIKTYKTCVRDAEAGGSNPPFPTRSQLGLVVFAGAVGFVSDDVEVLV